MGMTRALQHDRFPALGRSQSPNLRRPRGYKVYGLIVTVSEPLEQVPEEVTDAVTDVVPVVTNVANPGVEENVSREVLPEVQVALLVTSLLLLSVAVN